MNYQIITPEYPPQFGGVSDYTHQVAVGLAEAGDEVHVWAPAPEDRGQRSEVRHQSSGVMVHWEFGRFWPNDLRRVGKMLDQFPAPRRLLVQWVPHGFGLRAMNISFCLWLWNRACKGDVVEVMAHECYLPFKSWAIRQNIAAVIQRLMTIIILRAAQRVWVSIPAWETRFRPWCFGRHVPFTWLPVPSNIPVVRDPERIAGVRARFGINRERVLGHFGTYNQHDRKMLRAIFTELLHKNNGQKIILMGHGSEAMRQELVESQPCFSGLIHATGTLDAEQLSIHLSACDVMVQPCQGGVSGRKTTVIAGLAHSRQIVTTTGCLTEAAWSASKAVVLAACDDTTIIALEANRLLNCGNTRLGQAARQFYESTFALSRTISNLRST